MEIETVEIGTSQIGTSWIGTSQIGTLWIGTSQIGTLWIATLQIETGQSKDNVKKKIGRKLCVKLNFVLHGLLKLEGRKWVQ